MNTTREYRLGQAAGRSLIHLEGADAAKAAIKGAVATRTTAYNRGYLVGLAESLGRCLGHPAYDADYCPVCGTTTLIGERA